MRLASPCLLACGALCWLMETGSAQVIVGHRGASFDAPENTIAAFRLAWQQGADGIEGDFYLTKDGQMVCIHDADTLRTGGAKRIVEESTLAELRALEYGSWKDARYRGEEIPTFADVLVVVPQGKLFVIELKTGPRIVPVLRDELKRLDHHGVRLLIISFDKETVLACKQQMPDIRSHWLTGYKKDKKTGIWSPSETDVAQGLRDSHADGLGTQGTREIVTAEFVAGLRRQGMKEFHVWTVDDAEDATYFQSLGAVGITTNRPGYLRAILSRSGN